MTENQSQSKKCVLGGKCDFKRFHEVVANPAKYSCDIITRMLQVSVALTSCYRMYQGRQRA